LLNSSTVKAYCLILPCYLDFKGGPLANKASKTSLKIFRLPFIFDPQKSKTGAKLIYDFSDQARICESAFGYTKI
jgi:hypothetical protein